MTEMVDAVGDKIEIHTGGPNQGLTILSLGGQGFLSSEENLALRLAVSVIDHYKAGDLETCFKLLRKADACQPVEQIWEHARTQGGVERPGPPWRTPETSEVTRERGAEGRGRLVAGQSGYPGVRRTRLIRLGHGDAGAGGRWRQSPGRVILDKPVESSLGAAVGALKLWHDVLGEQFEGVI